MEKLCYSYSALKNPSRLYDKWKKVSVFTFFFFYVVGYHPNAFMVHYIGVPCKYNIIYEYGHYLVL